MLLTTFVCFDFAFESRCRGEFWYSKTCKNPPHVSCACPMLEVETIGWSFLSHCFWIVCTYIILRQYLHNFKYTLHVSFIWGDLVWARHKVFPPGLVESFMVAHRFNDSAVSYGYGVCSFWHLPHIFTFLYRQRAYIMGVFF